jgi:aldose 1-epimerase
MITPLSIGGAAIVTLRTEPLPRRASFVEATVLPGRGFMLLQAVIQRSDGRQVNAIAAPDPAAAARLLDGGPDDFAGNASFSFGGAILAPFANRVTGQPLVGSREIDTLIDGRRARLPRNWGGKREGARAYAMHGLILATPVPFRQANADAVSGILAAGDFGGAWPGQAGLEFEWRLVRGDLALRVVARNVGDQALPFGVGWHPYFRLCGDRRSARLRVPGRRRVEVNDYDEVLPAGRLLDVENTAYDFREGRPLGDLYLDDCFTDLTPLGGQAVAEILDTTERMGVRVASPAPPVRAIQVYAPPDKPFVALEPQFNLADPYGSVWTHDIDTGMQRVPPGGAVAYDVRVSPFEI